MMEKEATDLHHLGEPDLKVAGMQLWIHRGAYAEAPDPYDRDWLIVTAHVGAQAASVWTSGTILMLSDIAGWGAACDDLRDGRVAQAEMAPFEPDLKVCIRRADGLGHFNMQIDISPDYRTQAHKFEFVIDQTELRAVAQTCRSIVAKFGSC